MVSFWIERLVSHVALEKAWLIFKALARPQKGFRLCIVILPRFHTNLIDQEKME